MLAKANRITSADDYRVIVRRGAKVAGAHTVSYLRSRESGSDARFGFIVSKKVGGAVRRNLVRRRLKAAGYEAVRDGVAGVDIVVRALPSSSDAGWQALRAEVLRAVANRHSTRSATAGARTDIDTAPAAAPVPDSVAVSVPSPSKGD